MQGSSQVRVRRCVPDKNGPSSSVTMSRFETKLSDSSMAGHWFVRIARRQTRSLEGLFTAPLRPILRCSSRSKVRCVMTYANSTYMVLRLLGSAIYWFTSAFSEDGAALVTVDSDQPVTVSTNTKSTSSASSVAVFARQGLDPTKCHTITLKTTSNGRVDVDFFSVVLPDS